MPCMARSKQSSGFGRRTLRPLEPAGGADCSGSGYRAGSSSSPSLPLAAEQPSCASGGAWRSQLDATGRMEPPDVCALVSPDEISAIEGAPVRLKQPLTRTQGAEWVTFWCGYDYLAPAPPGPETREVHLQITAYADRAAAAAFLRSASGSYGHIGGLGEGATVLQPTAASSSLVVLVGNWILQIAGDRTGTYLDMPRVRQIAELLLQRL